MHVLQPGLCPAARTRTHAEGGRSTRLQMTSGSVSARHTSLKSAAAENSRTCAAGGVGRAGHAWHRRNRWGCCWAPWRQQAAESLAAGSGELGVHGSLSLHR